MIAIQSLSSRRGVSCRVLYGVLRTHNNARDEDSLSDKGNLCDYTDRAWLVSSLSLLHSSGKHLHPLAFDIV